MVVSVASTRTCMTFSVVLFFLLLLDRWWCGWPHWRYGLSLACKVVTVLVEILNKSAAFELVVARTEKRRRFCCFF